MVAAPMLFWLLMISYAVKPFWDEARRRIVGKLASRRPALKT